MIRPKAAPTRLDPLSYESLRQQVRVAMVGGVNHAARGRIWKSTVSVRATTRLTD